MFSLAVDFNEVRDGEVRGLAERIEGAGEPHEGDRVWVNDGSETAWATITRIERGLIYLAVDWDTFGEPIRHHEPTGAWWSMSSGAQALTDGHSSASGHRSADAERNLAAPVPA